MDSIGTAGGSEGTTEALAGIMEKIAEHKGCGTSGGSGKASCGSAAGEGDLPTDI
ncbi:nitrogenase cofactor biosynthesis protein NifB, partial [Methylocystis sp. 9N]